MRKATFCFLFLIAVLNSYAQGDTGLVVNQKGFLFLSAYNYQYDYKEGEEMRPLGFHDFFFPGENLNFESLLDSSSQLKFKNGIRIDFIKDRKALKMKAQTIQGKDTSMCYGFDRFYILPVIISYTRIKEYEPLICRRDFFDIKVENGSSVHFEYLHEAIKPIKIKKQTQSKNCKSKKGKKRR